MTIEVANPRFPVGLRVLVVDDDPLCLRIVEKMLKRCQYEGAAKIFFPHALALICAIGRRPFGMRRGERARGAGERRVLEGGHVERERVLDTSVMAEQTAGVEKVERVRSPLHTRG